MQSGMSVTSKDRWQRVAIGMVTVLTSGSVERCPAGVAMDALRVSERELATVNLPLVIVKAHDV